MRSITSHQVSPADKAMTITVLDAAGSGGAHHAYQITGADFRSNPAFPAALGVNPVKAMVILFQNGPIPANGVNGVTVEALLAICADRMLCFQAGPFPSDDNAAALSHLLDAIGLLQKRTIERMARGVEGTLSA